MSLLLLFNQATGSEPPPPVTIGKPRPSGALLLPRTQVVVDLADSDEDALALILAVL